MADSSIALCELEWTIAWNVRGDPSQSAFVAEVLRLSGVALPRVPNTGACGAGATILWLGPKSWLVVSHRDATAVEFDAARKAVNAVGGALFDLSSSYVGWKITGERAARVLNRACPLDFHPRAFARGTCAQSVLGHVNALYYVPGKENEFIVIVARSAAVDAWHELCASAETDGYRVEASKPFDGEIAYGK